MDMSVPITEPANQAIIGLGKRTMSHLINPILHNSGTWNLRAVCDVNPKATEHFDAAFPSLAISNYQSVEDLVTAQATEVSPIQCAYVALPHHCYDSVISLLLANGIHVLKEKPAGASTEQLMRHQALAAKHRVRVMTASQARSGERNSRLKELLPSVGKVCTVEGTRKLAKSDALGDGWRAMKTGGALGDLGWHLLDTVLGLVEPGSIPSVSHVQTFATRRSSHAYDCEDSAHLVLAGSGSHRPSYLLVISRVGHMKIDDLTFTGEKGVLTATGNDISLAISGKAVTDSTVSSSSDVTEMLSTFRREIALEIPSASYHRFALMDRVVVKTIHNMYEKKIDNVYNPPSDDSTNAEVEWPKITPEVAEAVNTQLHTDLSIYGNGGVFETFETEFKMFHHVPNSYALLHNSGTNALQAMYYAADFPTRAEIIFPLYTFHATSSPAMHFGIVPVFCDALPNGTISPLAIEAAITHRTKAIVITHMWGIPCDMGAIKGILQKHPSILLFEDCSHARGARVMGKAVGTFGDGAVWSLQGQKIVSGGEGGIALTRHAKFHYRMLCWGHYNKRCKAEIPQDHKLRLYALTGAGVKNRAHPLAISVALTQLRKLNDVLSNKATFAVKMIGALKTIPFLDVPDLEDHSYNHVCPAWYALVVRFKQNKAPFGLSRETFVQSLIERGLRDVDIPRSTGLLHREPLYTRPSVVLPHIYPTDVNMADGGSLEFPTAQKFYDEAIKFFVYADLADGVRVDHFVRTITELGLCSYPLPTTCISEVSRSHSPTQQSSQSDRIPSNVDSVQMETILNGTLTHFHALSASSANGNFFDKVVVGAAVLGFTVNGSESPKLLPRLQLLLLKRAEHEPYYPNVFELPSGKVSTNDKSLLDAFLRELYEESGLKGTRVLGRLPNMVYETSKMVHGQKVTRRAVQLNFVVEIEDVKADVKVNVNEHSEGGWWEAEQLKMLDITDGMREIVTEAFRWRRRMRSYSSFERHITKVFLVSLY